jgi:hypothetical protein
MAPSIPSQPFLDGHGIFQNRTTKADIPGQPFTQPISKTELGKVGGFLRDSITAPETDSGSKDDDELGDDNDGEGHRISGKHIDFRKAVIKSGFQAARKEFEDCQILSKTGSQGATFLHVALNPQGFEPKLFEAIKYVMDQFPDLYTKTHKEANKRTMVHVALLKSRAKSKPDPSRTYWLMENYPEKVAHILKGPSSSPSLLEDFMPVFLARPQQTLFSHLFGTPGSPENRPEPDWQPPNDGKNGKTLLQLAAEYTSDKPPVESGQNRAVTATEPSEGEVQTATRSASQPAIVTEDPKLGTELDWQLQVVRRVYDLWPKDLTADIGNENIRAVYPSPYRCRRLTLGKNKTGATVQDDKICMFLKDHIMHLPDSENIISQLGPDADGTYMTPLALIQNLYLMHTYPADLEIQLDLSEVPKMQTTTEIQALLERLKLQNILQYVVIPGTLFLSEDEVARASSADNDDDQGKGIARQGFKKIFEALQKKAVKKIIKLVVEDDEGVPHSDEVLEALRAFDIEIEDWDWRRVDISTEVLLQAAPKVKKLNLYSNGNPAVLHSWSGTDGLVLLPEVYIPAMNVRSRV